GPSKLGPHRLVLDAGYERPDPREVHLVDRDWLQSRLNEKRRQVQIRLEPDVRRDWRDQPLEPRADAALAAEVVEDDDAPARLANAHHLARDRNGIRDDADHIRRVDDVESL